jgi:hypothetical protein
VGHKKRTRWRLSKIKKGIKRITGADVMVFAGVAHESTQKVVDYAAKITDRRIMRLSEAVELQQRDFIRQKSLPALAPLDFKRVADEDIVKQMRILRQSHTTRNKLWGKSKP